MSAWINRNAYVIGFWGVGCLLGGVALAVMFGPVHWVRAGVMNALVLTVAREADSQRARRIEAEQRIETARRILDETQRGIAERLDRMGRAS